MYLVYIPETGKMFKYRVVKFPRKGVEQQTQTEGPQGEDDFTLLRRNMNPDICSPSDVDKTERVRMNLLKGLRL